ncbi:MAG: type II toxin-antitoxin system RelE/ParE family toxin [Methylotenera sp.]|nr:type II toxin-antitoxin system RelE/ParE family toxin [Methylotenera sp.]
MIEVIKSSQFSTWLDSVDSSVKVRVLARLSRVECGNFSDHCSVGDGISELRLFFGAGYRVYYTQNGNQVVVVLCAGDKSTQAKDIQLAKQIALEWR